MILAKILILDDIVENIKLLESILAKNGKHEVVPFSMPKEALRWIEKNEFDLALIDYRLPEMNGIEVCKDIIRIKQESVRPLILMVDPVERDIFQDAGDIGVQDFIVRPYDPTEVNHRVANLLDLFQKSELLKKYVLEVNTAVEEAVADIRDDAERYALAMRGSTDGIWDWDLKTGKVFYSEAWARMLGYETKEISQLPSAWLNRVHPQDLRRVNDQIDQHMNHRTEKFSCEYRVRKRSGEYTWMLARAIGVKNSEGEIVRFVGSQTDINELKVTQELLTHNAFHDMLTGLPNRALFMERLNQAYIRFKRSGDHTFAVMYIDLDFFKAINDTYGHDAGDQLLKEVTKRLQTCVREVDTVARIGGDEFIVLLTDVESLEDVEQSTKRIVAEVCRPMQICGVDMTPSLSIGIHLCDSKSHRNAEEVMKDADFALYKAKETGRSKYVFYEPGMRKESPRYVEIKSGLSSALENNEISMYFQPIMDIQKDIIVGFEALMRWDHPRLGLVSPDDFIHVAEETQIIVDLSDFAVQQSFMQLKKWQKYYTHETPFFISINFSKRHILQPDFVTKLREAIETYQISPHDVVLEFCEKTLTEAMNQNATLLDSIRDLGCRISLDDYGIGRSSLITLADVPVDYIKIDRSLILDLKESERSRKLFAAITALCRELELETIIEGVQDKEILDYVRRTSNRYAQGFYFAVPQPAERIDQMLKKTA